MADKVITIWNDSRWRVLFDITKLDRVKPWQIKLVEILRTLMEELERYERLDLNSCGIAACSAAIIHRMKTERLLKADTPTIDNKQVISDNLIVPPPMDLPYMPEFMITTVGELVQALKTLILRMEKKDGNGEGSILDVFDVKIDEFLVKIEERLEEFVQGIQRLFGDREIIDVSNLFMGVDRLEAARRFILLLFAAARGVVELIEDEECRLIAVRLLDTQSLQQSIG
ncbi:MAG: hypothetical protein N3F65_02195 [Nitrososphaeria archaeon]|nr:hypothetical protein [Aigarchaeota archaeon]MCX8187403.1 hypothetical protein [Nitrososphaeria archaeon]MDW8021812.1 hypothetical protein [Nitrososphaerota archaeon]